MEQSIAKDNMIRQQLRPAGVLQNHILDVIAKLPREAFMDENLQSLAYSDAELTLANGVNMISLVDLGLMIQALEIKQHENILLVGTGSGYEAALLAKLGKYVYSIDVDANVTEQAKQNLAKLNIDNVTCSTGRVQNGWEKDVSFDVILSTYAMPFLPHVLQDCLAKGGRMVIVIGKPPTMQATLYKRTADNDWQSSILFETSRPYLKGISQPDHFVF